MFYVLGIDDTFTNDNGDKLYKAAGFNSLVFDSQGISRLSPLQTYLDAESERVWRAAERIENDPSFFSKMLKSGITPSTNVMKAVSSNQSNLSMLQGIPLSEIQDKLPEYFVDNYVASSDYKFKVADVVSHFRLHRTGVIRDVMSDEFVCVKVSGGDGGNISYGIHYEIWETKNLRLKDHLSGNSLEAFNLAESDKSLCDLEIMPANEEVK